MIGMSAAIETLKPEWCDPEFGHRFGTLQQLEREAPGRPLVLILGTSRTQNAIDPSAMGFPEERGSPRVFNFGQSGSPPLKVYLNLARLLDAGIRPAAVVVEVLPVWLTSDGPAEDLFANEASLLTSADLRRLAPFCNHPVSLGRKWLSARAAPWHAQRFVLMNHWLPRWLEWRQRIDFQWKNTDENGFTPFPGDEPPSDVRAAATSYARKSYRGTFEGFPFGPSSLEALRALVARCRHEEIPVAFVELPVAPLFRGWFRPGVWESGDERLVTFARSLGVELFLPHDDVADSEYVDGHHMLHRAAKTYSRWLAHTHLQPWLVREGVAR